MRTDLDAALDQIAESEPFAHERYRRDPAFAADVHEHVRRARQLAADTRATVLAMLLPTDALRAQYERDPLFAAKIGAEASARAIAILKIEAEAAAEAEEPDDTKH